MSNGILQTALTRVPLELEYRPHSTSDEGNAFLGPACNMLAFRQDDSTLRDEFEYLLSAI
ncbi:MAG: hypothetical protein HY010_03525 [Acidobacteria bacterium]|nr:hypothetical protein [Acidobacteriota bacterium]